MEISAATAPQKIGALDQTSRNFVARHDGSRNLAAIFFTAKIFVNPAETPGIFAASHSIWRTLKWQEDQCA